MKQILYRVRVSLGRNDALYYVDFDNKPDAKAAAERASRVGFDVKVEPRIVAQAPAA